MLRFQLFGFPVAVHWLFWVNTALFGGGLSASTPEQIKQLILWVIAAFVSVLIHELGHTFLMRRYGARASIMLYGFGGLAIPDRGFNRVQNILVSLAGPALQIGLGFAVAELARYILPGVTTLHSFLGAFTYISIFWGILNLVPIYPLDGGHVLLHFLGPRLAKITYTVGIVCAIALGIWFLTAGSIFAPIFFGMMAYENFQRLQGGSPNSLLRPY
jgi:stage IV sporulation protein FB